MYYFLNYNEYYYFRVTIPNSQIQSYIDAIKAAISRSKGNLQIIMTIIPPNNKVEIYSAIKKLCYVDYGSKFAFMLITS